jgi:hypothetical protein
MKISTVFNPTRCLLLIRNELILSRSYILITSAWWMSAISADVAVGRGVSVVAGVSVGTGVAVGIGVSVGALGDWATGCSTA